MCVWDGGRSLSLSGRGHHDYSGHHLERTSMAEKPEDLNLPASAINRIVKEAVSLQVRSLQQSFVHFKNFITVESLSLLHNNYIYPHSSFIRAAVSKVSTGSVYKMARCLWKRLGLGVVWIVCHFIC